MPDGDHMYGSPEQLLAGSDRPRPLPAPLRARLEEALEGLAGDGALATARPLSGEARDKLAASLRPDGPEGPAEPAGPEAPEKKWRTWAPRLSVAAAVIIALAIFVPTLSHPPGAGPGASHAAAGIESSPSGSSIRALPPRPLAVPARVGAAANTSTPSTAAGTSMASGAGTSSGSPGGTSGASPASTSSGSAANAPTLTIPPARMGAPTQLTPEKSSVGPPEAAFSASVPVVSGLSPSRGPQAGGDWVTVRGTGLSGTSKVYFGGVAAPRVSVLSSAELKAVAPAHAAGTVDVVVEGPAGKSKVSAAGRYSFGS
jgi:hypothetical protein